MKSAAGSFDCRYEIGESVVVLTRQGMPAQTFEVRVELNAAADIARATQKCGFLLFVERGMAHQQITARLLQELRRIWPIPISEESLSGLQEVARVWILFNFRPSLENPNTRE